MSKSYISYLEWEKEWEAEQAAEAQAKKAAQEQAEAWRKARARQAAEEAKKAAEAEETEGLAGLATSRGVHRTTVWRHKKQAQAEAAAGREALAAQTDARAAEFVERGRADSAARKAVSAARIKERGAQRLADNGMQTGSFIKMSAPDLPLKEFNALTSQVENAVMKQLGAIGKNGVFTKDFEKGTARLATDVTDEASVAKIKAMIDSFNGTSDNPKYENFNVRDGKTIVTNRTIADSDERTRKSMKYYGREKGLTVGTDGEGNTTAFGEVRNRGAWGIFDRESESTAHRARKRAAVTALKNDIEGNTSRRLDYRTRASAAELAWAKDKKNRKNPIAKEILKKHKAQNQSMGGKLLRNAGTALFHGAVRAGLGALNMAKQKTLQFLALLPGMADNLHTLSVAGARMNIPAHKLDEYVTLSNKLGMSADGSEIMKILGHISAKLSNPITGDLSGMIQDIAAIDNMQGGGVATQAAVNFFTEKSHSPDDFFNAVVNSLLRATLSGATLTHGAGTLDPEKAFVHNIEYARKALGNEGVELISRLFEHWRATGKDPALLQGLVAGKDATAIIANANGEKPLTKTGVAGGVATGAARETVTAINSLKSDMRAVLGGILLKILAQMQPLVEYVRTLLKNVLFWIADKGPEVLQAPAQRAAMSMEMADRAENQKSLRFITPQLENAKQLAEAARKKLGVFDGLSDDKIKKAYEAGLKGFKPDGVSTEAFLEWMGEESLYRHAKSDYDALVFESTQERQSRVPDVTPLGLANRVENDVFQAGNAIAKEVDRNLNAGNRRGADYYKNEEARLLGEISEAEEAKKRTENSVNSYFGDESKIGEELTADRNKAYALPRLKKELDALREAMTLVGEEAGADTPKPDRLPFSERSKALDKSSDAGQLAYIKSAITDQLFAGGLGKIASGIVSGDVSITAVIKAADQNIKFTLTDKEGKVLQSGTINNNFNVDKTVQYNAALTAPDRG